MFKVFRTDLPVHLSFAMQQKPPKVIFFGTHPKQFNGYSKVVYELCQELAKHPSEIEFIVYGFQNFYLNGSHRTDLSPHIKIYDAFLHEDPKKNGFGIEQVKAFVEQEHPDVCIVYNDMVVVSQVMQQLLKIPPVMRTFKIIVYMDQVYLNQRKEYIEFVNRNADEVMLFTPYWEQNIKNQGLRIPTSHLQHGINPMHYYPIPKMLARNYYGLKNDDFIILNLNRNQPRKRWDTCLKAFAEIVSRYPNEPIKLLVGTAIQGAWNLLEVFERELDKRGLSLEIGMRHLILFDHPQKVTDEDTNILYNVADIGINTCDGEGFGLCNFEQAAVGIPQIVPRLGGFLDFFDDSCAQMIDPIMAYYVDHTRDAVAGEALLCNYMDFANAIERYYKNKDLRDSHGRQARARILKNYGWGDLAKKLIQIVHRVQPPPPPPAPVTPIMPIPMLTPIPSSEDAAELAKEIDKIDISTLQLKNPHATTSTSSTASQSTPYVQAGPAAAAPVAVAHAPKAISTAIPTAAKKRQGKKKKGLQGMDLHALKDLQKKLTKLLDGEADDEDKD